MVGFLPAGSFRTHHWRKINNNEVIEHRFDERCNSDTQNPSPWRLQQMMTSMPSSLTLEFLVTMGIIASLSTFCFSPSTLHLPIHI